MGAGVDGIVFSPGVVLATTNYFHTTIGPEIVRKNMKIKKFTKIVAVRAGKLSTGQFGTEIWRESNRADGISPSPYFETVSYTHLTLPTKRIV